MIAEFTFLFWYIALTVPLFWLIPSHLGALRLSYLAFVSIALLWMLSPFILIVLAFFAMALAGFAAAARQGAPKARLKKLSWLLFSPLVLVELIPVDIIASGILGPRAVEVASLRGFALLGLSYAAIRAFIMSREYIDGTPATPFQALATFVFFGSFIAGPITGSKPYKTIADRLTLEALMTGLARLGWGAAVFLVLRQAVADADLATVFGAVPDSTAALWIETYQALAVLYLDFAGYTEMAIGMALLFGVTLPENFRYPFLAKSMQEFWQRWHLSLGAFIGTYLFKPLVRSYGKPTLAIFIAFVLVGLWHRFSLPYFIWGIGHGGALAWEMYYRRESAKGKLPKWPTGRVLTPVSNVIGWVYTMTFVAVLSYFATRPDAATAFAYLSKLFGAAP